MLTGRGVSLESQFRLTYSMILNLMRVEDLKVSEGGNRRLLIIQDL
jgi:antiviral helicase SKI2